MGAPTPKPIKNGVVAGDVLARVTSPDNVPHCRVLSDVKEIRSGEALITEGDVSRQPVGDNVPIAPDVDALNDL